MKAGQLDIFGEATEAVQRKKGWREVFTDYEAYVKKFTDAPKTTDDTYTPPDVFEAVLEWLAGKGKLTDGTPIVRPFYPGGDFETADYPDGCVVVDNPPFSIFTKCCKWYTARRIPFFLFGPGLTGCNVSDFCTFICISSAIRFVNGAVIPVCFASNMFGGLAAMAAGDLTEKISGCKSQRKETKAVRRIEWPDGLVTVSELRTIASAGMSFCLDRRFNECVHSIGNEKMFGAAWLSGQHEEAAAAAAKAAAAAAAAVKVEMLPSERQTLERLCRLYRESGGNAPEIQPQK